MDIRRKKDTYLYPKAGRMFYTLSVFIFGIIAVLSFVNCFVNGFTDERIAVILMNLWFMLFTMDVVTIRFKRQGEKAYWHDWVIFSKENTASHSDNSNSIDLETDNVVIDPAPSTQQANNK